MSVVVEEYLENITVAVEQETLNITVDVQLATEGGTDKLDKQPNIQALWRGSQADYDAIVTKDANTIYFINE